MPPLSIAGAMALSGGMQAGGGIFNAAMTSRQNKLNREWHERMWHMENAYNHPREQFQRMLKSGLNPKLMYEKGDTGNAGTIGTPSQETPRYGDALAAVGDTFGGIYDYRVKAAQIDLMDEEKWVKKAQALNLMASTAGQNLKNRETNALFQSTVDAARLGVEKIAAEIRNTNIIGDAKKQDMQVQLREQTRKELETAKNMRMAKNILINDALSRDLTKQQIANLKDAKTNLKLDAQLKAIDIKMRKNNINWNDPAYIRVLQQILNTIRDKGLDALDFDFWEIIKKQIWE